MIPFEFGLAALLAIDINGAQGFYFDNSLTADLFKWPFPPIELTS